MSYCEGHGVEEQVMNLSALELSFERCCLHLQDGLDYLSRHQQL